MLYKFAHDPAVVAIAWLLAGFLTGWVLVVLGALLCKLTDRKEN
jgi:hypothetical protein